MKYSKPVRATTRRTTRIPFAILLVAIAVIVAIVGYPLLASSPTAASLVSPLPATSSPTATVLSYPLRATSSPTAPSPDNPLPELPSPTATSPGYVLHRERPSPPGAADGVLFDGTTVFDQEIPGVANLDPALLGALRQAAIDAADEGVEFYVNSGWRSPEYQEQLFHEAVSEYGSEEEAARWVALPSTSAHVSGDAVDIGPRDAADWLSVHGAGYGLCQIYSNEPWHFELRPEAIYSGCPSMYADPTHDPRMQQ